MLRVDCKVLWSCLLLLVLPVVVAVDPMCDIVAATNIQSILSQWSCTTGGVTSTTPCTPPVWTGLSCNSGSVVKLTFTTSPSLTGTH